MEKCNVSSVADPELSSEDPVLMPLILVQIVVLLAAESGLAVAGKHPVTESRVNDKCPKSCANNIGIK
jgi:hypothetical protein